MTNEPNYWLVYMPFLKIAVGGLKELALFGLGYGTVSLLFPRLRCLLGFHDWNHQDRAMWELYEGRDGWADTPCKRCPAKLPPQTVDYL